jgi:type II secretory pathway pseudopilin PulG
MSFAKYKLFHLQAKSLKLKAAHGFTLIELLIYAGLSLVVVTLFASVLITITRIQSQQNSSRQVANEASFIINVMKQAIRDAQSLTVSTNRLELATNSSTTNPTVITFADNSAYIKQASEASTTLNTSRVIISGLNFSRSYSGTNELVNIDLTVEFNTENPAQNASQHIQTSVAPLNRSN